MDGTKDYFTTLNLLLLFFSQLARANIKSKLLYLARVTVVQMAAWQINSCSLQSFFLFKFGLLFTWLSFTYQFSKASMLLTPPLWICHYLGAHIYCWSKVSFIESPHSYRNSLLITINHHTFARSKANRKVKYNYLKFVSSWCMIQMDGSSWRSKEERILYLSYELKYPSWLASDSNWWVLTQGSWAMSLYFTIHRSTEGLHCNAGRVLPPTKFWHRSYDVIHILSINETTFAFISEGQVW